VSLLHKRDLSGYYGDSGDFPGATAAQLIPPRTSYGTVGTVPVTNATALRHSAVWACLRLRANLISTMPVDAFRRVGGVQVEVPKTPILVTPGGDAVDILEWLYSSQFDLDRAGNAFGLVTERTGFGLPARIDLVPVGEVAVKIKQGRIDSYRIGSEEYDPADVWHEKQYTVAGLHVGLSPVAYAAWSIGEYLSIQQFALQWFGNGQHPSAMLRNQEKTIPPKEAAEVKERFKAAIRAGDVFVTGKDWTYEMLQAEQAGSSWLEAKGYGIADVARFFDCPANLIDAAVQGGGDSITYANIVQRNLQLLIMHLGPAIVRRENALTRLLPQPRYVKLNTNALLRMDPATQVEVLARQIASRQMAPSEARELMDRRPFTPEQLAEFDRFWPPKAEPAAKIAPVPAGD
jgi:HK97 family phage portal protein